MPATLIGNLNPSVRTSGLMGAAIGVVACVAADLTHEILGHLSASLITGDPVVSLSTVAMQSATPNRFVAAAGTSANVIAGSLSLFFLGKIHKFSTWSLFLWVFGAFNLLNCGYLVASAMMNNGDWAAVIRGYAPAWLWRVLIGIVGALIYALSVRWMTRCMVRIVQNGSMGLLEVRRYIWSAYLAGGVVLTLAAMLNPISPSLILLSGIAASFGLNWGILLVPQSLEKISAHGLPQPPSAKVTLAWITSALIIGGTFIALLGPGIRFSP